MPPVYQNEPLPVGPNGSFPSHGTCKQGLDIDDKDTSWAVVANDYDVTVEVHKADQRDKRRVRQSFSAEKRIETANTRSTGACRVCRKRKLRCHQNHSRSVNGNFRERNAEESHSFLQPPDYIDLESGSYGLQHYGSAALEHWPSDRNWNLLRYADLDTDEILMAPHTDSHQHMPLMEAYASLPDDGSVAQQDPSLAHLVSMQPHIWTSNYSNQVYSQDLWRYRDIGELQNTWAVGGNPLLAGTDSFGVPSLTSTQTVNSTASCVTCMSDQTGLRLCACMIDEGELSTNAMIDMDLSLPDVWDDVTQTLADVAVVVGEATGVKPLVTYRDRGSSPIESLNQSEARSSSDMSPRVLGDSLPSNVNQIKGVLLEHDSEFEPLLQDLLRDRTSTNDIGWGASL